MHVLLRLVMTVTRTRHGAAGDSASDTGAIIITVMPATITTQTGSVTVRQIVSGGITLLFCLCFCGLLTVVEAFEAGPNCIFGKASLQVTTRNLSTPSTECTGIGGLFSIHRSIITDEATFECSKLHFHRFGVEQTEALILAMKKLSEEGSSSLRSTKMYDTCGEAVDSQCISDVTRSLVQPDNRAECALATILAPFYFGDGLDSPKTASSILMGSLFRDASKGYKDLPERAIFSLVDEPYPSPEDVHLNDLEAQTIFMQASCELQASAMIDFLLRARWRKIFVVVNGDECGRKSKIAFEQEIQTRQLECDIDAEYYESGSDIIKQKRAADDIDVPLTPGELWRYCLNKPESPRAIVLLSSITYAWKFFKAYENEAINKTSFGFLLGDFWGNPLYADELYEMLMKVAETARTVVALRTRTKGLDKFQEHVASIRANSTEIQQNPLLADYWESIFNCSLSAGTCSNTSSLSPIRRPILRNYKTSLVIDSAYFLSEYIKKYANSLKENFSFKKISVENLQVMSETGNEVRIGQLETKESPFVFVPILWSFRAFCLDARDAAA